MFTFYVTGQIVAPTRMVANYAIYRLARRSQIQTPGGRFETIVWVKFNQSFPEAPDVEGLNLYNPLQINETPRPKRCVPALPASVRVDAGNNLRNNLI